MNRVKMLAATVIPALVVGVFVSHAAPAGDDGAWNTGVIVADNSQPKKHRRIPPGPPIPPPTDDVWGDHPTPPTPPTPPQPRGKHGGVKVSIHGNQVHITGIDEVVTEHLDAVAQALNNPKVPKAVRDKINARMGKVRGIVDKRLKNVKTSDLDQLEAELEKLESDLEEALEGLDDDLKDLGKDLGKDLAKQLGKDLLKGKIQIVDGSDDSDDSDDRDDSDDAGDDHVPDTVIADLDDIALKPTQRNQIAKLRADSEARVAQAKQQLDDASQRLETALADPKTTDAQVALLVDQVSSHEAAIRKARLLAWVGARRVLDVDQVKKLEQAAKQR